MEKKLTRPALENLLKSPDYRAFLREYLELGKAHGETMSLLSKRAGLSSAGFLSDVIKGNKALSAKSLPKVKEALQIPEGLQDFFEFLVFQEIPELAPSHLQGEKLTKQLRALRSRLKQPSTNPRGKDVETFARTVEYQILHAALEPDRGLSIQELRDRTRLQKETIEQGLELFRRLNLVYEFDGKFQLQQEVFDQIQKEAGIDLHEGLESIMNLLAKRVQARNIQDDELFFWGSFRATEKDFAQLKTQLRKSILHELDKTLPSEGDRVAMFFFSIFKPA